MIPNPICFKLDWQLARLAFSRTLAKTGNKIAARTDIMAITTSSSISVNALATRLVELVQLDFLCDFVDFILQLPIRNNGETAIFIIPFQVNHETSFFE